MGSLTRLSVLALQYNKITGQIPASLGNLGMLKRLDLGFNKFFGTIPAKLASIPSLEVLDIRNNSLSGVVSPGKTAFHPHFSFNFFLTRVFFSD